MNDSNSCTAVTLTHPWNLGGEGLQRVHVAVSLFPPCTPSGKGGSAQCRLAGLAGSRQQTRQQSPPYGGVSYTAIVSAAEIVRVISLPTLHMHAHV